MRFDERKSIYRDCRWCGGRGCLACEGEANKAYKSEFPDGPKPIATFSLDEVEAARDVIGHDAFIKTFGPNGGGIDEIISNLKQSRDA